MFVKAAEGLTVPTEQKGGEVIGDKPVEVARTAYYLRLIKDGSLEVTAKPKKETTPASAGTTTTPQRKR